MKRFIYSLSIIAALASCAKEAAEESRPEAAMVPLNVTIQTKAAGGSGDEAPAQDIRSVRIVVFKNTGNPANDLLVLNEYYAFGFGVDNRTDGRYTVTVKPTLELDKNTDLYYVYAVLNEEGYELPSTPNNKNLGAELEGLANRGQMADLLSTPAVYPSAGIKSAPYCLMSACKTVDFSGGKDLPIEVHFGFDSNNVDKGGAADRSLAQITVESIKSASSTTVGSQLPKVFVLDVKLVNVPSGIAWGTDPGNTDNGKVDLQIGEATEDIDGTHKYYKRLWDGNVYKNVQVVGECVQRMTANYYRTAKTGNDGWAFYDDRDGATPITKYTYQGTATHPGNPPTPVDKPFGFPTLSDDGKKWVYKISTYKNGKWDSNGDKTAEIKNYADADEAYDAAYNDYVNHLPNKGDKKNVDLVTEEEASAYNTYWPIKAQYDIDLAAYEADYANVYPSAESGRSSIDAQYSASNSVGKLLTDLAGIFQKKTYYSTNKFTVTGVSNPQPTGPAYETYCSEDSWTVNLGDSYYVPENISTSPDNTETTCVKVTLAVAAPDITVPSGIDISKLPEAGEATGGTYTYYFDHYYQTKTENNKPSVLTKQVIDLSYTGNVGDDAHKIYRSKLNKDGVKYDAPDKVNFSIATLFGLDGHIVDADDETIECTAATVNNKYHVYIAGESFWRSGTGLTATTTVDNDQEGATFSWNIPTADDESTTDFKEVKEFYIPVNNAQFDGDYSVRRNTKYTVKLIVGENTYDSFTKASGPAGAAGGATGLSVTADVSAEIIAEEDED